MPRCGCYWCVSVRSADKKIRPHWWQRITMPPGEVYEAVIEDEYREPELEG